jgi:hypothetical protein
VSAGGRGGRPRGRDRGALATCGNARRFTPRSAAPTHAGSLAALARGLLKQASMTKSSDVPGAGGALARWRGRGRVRDRPGGPTGVPDDGEQRRRARAAARRSRWRPATTQRWHQAGLATDTGPAHHRPAHHGVPGALVQRPVVGVVHAGAGRRGPQDQRGRVAAAHVVVLRRPRVRVRAVRGARRAGAIAPADAAPAAGAVMVVDHRDDAASASVVDHRGATRRRPAPPRSAPPPATIAGGRPGWRSTPTRGCWAPRSAATACSGSAASGRAGSCRARTTSTPR